MKMIEGYFWSKGDIMKLLLTVSVSPLELSLQMFLELVEKRLLLSCIWPKLDNTKLAFSVSISGIAASLLTCGRNAHSTFNFPLDLTSSDIPVRVMIKTFEMTRAKKVLVHRMGRMYHDTQGSCINVRRNHERR